MLKFAKKTAESLRKRVISLPVVSDKLIETHASERLAAEAGLVPKRCGLCRHFSREEWEQGTQREAAFSEAMRYLRPGQMGRTRTSPMVNPGSDAARALRPTLTEEWRDYGVCMLHNPNGAPAVWGFAEQPEMPQADSPPCGEWL